MPKDQGFQKLGDLFSKEDIKKAPAFQWQELALRIAEELKVPVYKRSSIFKACKENPKAFIEMCLADTKELCKTGEKWKYFFKLISQK